jgi:hypothetical protein
MAAPGEVHHARDESFQVAFSPKEVAQVAKEIADETVAPVTLSLFIFWVREKPENYEEAKSHIRQLSLDKVRGRVVGRYMAFANWSAGLQH